MRVASLGSGSRGNSIYVEAGETRLLVDAGFSGVQIERRLRAVGVSPETVEAVVVTHEHRDHTSGMGVAARRWSWPLYMAPETLEACDDLLHGHEEVRLFRGGSTFSVGELTVASYFTCHDAAAPLAVTLTHPVTGLKLGLATDLGRPTTAVRHALRASHFLVLEANHDEVLLREGPYPWSIKERIGGSRGHLSNRVAAELLEELIHEELCGVLLAHLSETCNDPDRALRAVRPCLERSGFSGVLRVAGQREPTRLFDLERLHDGVRSGPQIDLFGQAVGS